jgi:hypothetical protein
MGANGIDIVRRAYEAAHNGDQTCLESDLAASVEVERHAAIEAGRSNRQMTLHGREEASRFLITRGLWDRLESRSGPEAEPGYTRLLWNWESMRNGLSMVLVTVRVSFDGAANPLGLIEESDLVHLDEGDSIFAIDNFAAEPDRAMEVFESRIQALSTSEQVALTASDALMAVAMEAGDSQLNDDQRSVPGSYSELSLAISTARARGQVFDLDAYSADDLDELGSAYLAAAVRSLLFAGAMGIERDSWQSLRDRVLDDLDEVFVLDVATWSERALARAAQALDAFVGLTSQDTVDETAAKAFAAATGGLVSWTVARYVFLLLYLRFSTRRRTQEQESTS